MSDRTHCFGVHSAAWRSRGGARFLQLPQVVEPQQHHKRQTLYNRSTLLVLDVILLPRNFSDWLAAGAPPRTRARRPCTHARTPPRPIPYQVGLTSNGPRCYQLGARGNVALKDNVSDPIAVWINLYKMSNKKAARHKSRIYGGRYFDKGTHNSLDMKWYFVKKLIIVIVFHFVEGDNKMLIR